MAEYTAWEQNPDGYGIHVEGRVIYPRCDKWLALPSGAREPCPRHAIWRRSRKQSIATEGITVTMFQYRCDWHTPEGETP